MRCLFLPALALILGALPLSVAAQSPHAERPAYAVGDTWTRADVTYRLERVDRNTYVFVAGDRQIWLTRDLKIQYVRPAGESLKLDPPGPGCPLEVGRRGAGVGIVRLRSADNGDGEVYGTWRVIRVEDVEAGGRRLEALRIHDTFEPEIPGRFNASPYQQYGLVARAARFEYTAWYATSVLEQEVVRKTRSIGDKQNPVRKGEHGGHPAAHQGPRPLA
jgi:hypothetical protein